MLEFADYVVVKCADWALETVICMEFAAWELYVPRLGLLSAGTVRCICLGTGGLVGALVVSGVLLDKLLSILGCVRILWSWQWMG